MEAQSGMLLGPILLLGALLALLLFGLLPLILGIVALVRINRSNGALRGRGLAVAAIVLGALVLLGSPVLLVGGLVFVNLGTVRAEREEAMLRERDEAVRVAAEEEAKRRAAEEESGSPNVQVKITSMREGALAALELARIGKTEVEKYMAHREQHPSEAWTPAKLTSLREALHCDLVIEDAIILSDNILVASASTGLPQTVSGTPEPPLHDLAGVTCMRGTLVREGQSVPCWVFKVPINISGKPEADASARLIVRIE